VGRAYRSIPQNLRDGNAFPATAEPLLEGAPKMTFPVTLIDSRRLDCASAGDPDQEYFADGMVEEIITALSRVRSFFVIARLAGRDFRLLQLLALRHATRNRRLLPFTLRVLDRNLCQRSDASKRQQER
jgi:hypothetical protein